MINMCSGTNTTRWKELEKNGVVVINVDVALGVNALDPHVAGWLDDVIRSGKVVMWTAGPPCKTVSVCRMNGEVDGGPKPLRTRWGEERFGKHTNTASQQEAADHDAALWLQNLWFMKKVRKHNPQADLLTEQPQDPQEWCQWAKDCPTFLQWPETKSIVKDLKLQEVRLCQGGLGHSTMKPTTLLTTSEDLEELEGAGGQHKGEAWPEDVEARMKKSSGLAEWAPGLVQAIKMVVKQKVMEEPTMKALSTKERQAATDWKRHVEMNHMPYRRDCALCVASMGRDRPRMRQKMPEPYTLGIDLAGPFIEGKDQHERSKPKYFLIAVMTIPMQGERPLVESLRRLGGDYEEMVVPVPPVEDEPGEKAEGKASEKAQCLEDPEEEAKRKAEIEELVKELEMEMEKPASEEPSQEKDPFEVQASRGDGKDEELSEAQVKELDQQNQQWKQYIAHATNRPVQTLTQAFPILSRKATEVIKAAAQATARLRALGIPINRVHTDRAREFCGKEFKAWIRNRELFHTTTAGDEPASNARAENEIKVLKGRARVLMKTTQSNITRWPLALRFAAEERFRAQLKMCGVPTPAMIPFGTKALAKQKAWQNRTDGVAKWKDPMIPVTVWGPAHDMSMTSRGYLLEVEATGKFMRSTVIVVPKQAPAIADPTSYAAPADPVDRSKHEEAVEDDFEYEQSILPEDEDHMREAEVHGGWVAAEGGGDGSATDQMELVIDKPPERDEGIPVHDAPRRRLYGKQTVRMNAGRQQEPILRALRIGGEWEHGSEWEVPPEDEWETLMLTEHEGLMRWAREERHVARDPTTIHVLLQAEATAATIEQQLQQHARQRKLEAGGG